MYKNLIQLVKSLAKHNFISPINIARLRYLYILHKWPHFKHPKDLNEKINYLKFYGNTSLWQNFQINMLFVNILKIWG